MNEVVKQWIDWFSFSATLAALAGALPVIVLVLTGLWTVIRIYEAVMGKPFAESRIARFLRGE